MSEAPYCSVHQRYLRVGECVDCKALLDRLENAEKKRDALRAELEQVTRERDSIRAVHNVTMALASAAAGDKDDEWSPDIRAAHPTRSGSHETYAVAMQMVGHRRSKGALVEMVNWLLLDRDKLRAELALEKTRVANLLERVAEREMAVQAECYRSEREAAEVAEARKLAAVCQALVDYAAAVKP